MPPSAKDQLLAAEKNLDDNLEIYQNSITALDTVINADVIDVEKAELELEFLRDQHKAVIRLTELYVEHLRINKLDADAKVQINRRAELMKNMKFVEKYCEEQLQGTTAQHSDVSHTNLPKKDLGKYDGNVRGWLAFWGVFEEIHVNKHLSNSEKLNYLKQSLLTDSPAHKLVCSFPAAGQNYEAAVDRLTERFGRKKLLIKVYMRDLVKLVVDNCNGDSHTDFIDLVTALDSQIRNLEQLGITTDQFGDLLYAVVEGCIPAPVLEAYKRAPDCKEELDDLMDYLQLEVHRRIETTLAHSVFAEEGSSTSNRNKQQKLGKISSNKQVNQVPKTAAGFVNTTGSRDKNICTFCAYPGHTPTDCRLAVKMDLKKRKEKLIENNACFNCFKKGHGTKKCKSKMTCIICGKNHHALMCQSQQQETSPTPPPTPTPQDNTTPPQAPPQTPTSPSMSNCTRCPEVLLQMLTVQVEGPRGIRKVRAAYDSLSSLSHVTESVAREINLPVIGHEKLTHQVFGGTTTAVQNHPIYQVRVSGIHEKEPYEFKVAGVPRISASLPALPTGPYLEECKQKGITLTDLESPSGEIEILFGADIGDRLKVGGEFIQLDAGPVALHTKVGWIISGTINPSPINSSTLAMSLISNPVSEKDVASFWSLETLGITDPVETKSRAEIEKSALQHFQRTVRQDSTGRYHIRHPWIDGHPPLPHNKGLAERRLQSATKKIIEDGYLSRYDEVFKAWQQEGLIETVPPPADINTCHYLPHRAVFKEGSTTPLRPVFDASAKRVNQPSLNDCLEKGPNLLELIPAILSRFRLERIGVVADIRKAFQQLMVMEEDRDKMRFLWWEDVPACTKLKEYRHTRVVFGVSSSPFLLGATLKHHLANYPAYDETKKLLNSSFYVDNTVASLPTMEEARRFQSEAIKILQAGQFDLRGWEFGPTSEDKHISVLGLVWNLRDDTLNLDIKKIITNMEVPPTKRNLYKLINMLFDPMGYAAPFTVVAKIILKNVCLQAKLKWDDQLPFEAALEFDRWKKQLPELKEIKIPRHVFGNEDDHSYSLHCFVDASKDSFATCVFLRVDNGLEVKVYLLQCKTRVSPKNGATIPRLELLSCLIGARLMSTIQRDLGKDWPAYYWTDSTTALTWIQRQDSWATFVNNRVNEIRKLSDPTRWSHIPGVLNPADLPSRGCTVKKLVESNWFRGPSWLYQPQQHWTTDITVAVDEMEVNQEKKRLVVAAVNIKEEETSQLIQSLLRCGSYQKILRVTAYILRFAEKTKKKATLSGHISCDELAAAERAIIILIQSTLDAADMKNVPIVKDDHGIIRLESRLTYGEEKESFKYPALLPGKHPLTALLIQHEHEKSCHAGVQFIQSHLRENYWITRSRKTIRNVIHKCAVCRRHIATRCNVAEPSLPADRVNLSKTFEITGVDVTGPLFVEKGTKVWIALFTCAVYRAIHLEILPNMSTEAFLVALQKFVARRGRPSVIYSDNGTNFTGASHLLRNVNWDEVEQQTAVNKITWRFNPPSAAWWGGWWERLIGLTKAIMRRVIGSRRLKLAQLEVLLMEVESIMNNRPLTYISDDPNDLRPLTPANFLRDLPVAALPELDLVDGRGFRINLRKIQKLKQELRDRFRKEYLGQLIHREKTGKTTTINPGSVVLIETENQKRIDWPMGVVQETFPGKDGQHRVAKIKTNRGVIVRPLQRLFPLECKSDALPLPEREAEDQTPEGVEDN